MNCELEEMYFGEKLGSKGLYQISPQQFQLECLSSNLSAGDSTGLRLYNGCHVVIRLIACYTEFTKGLRVVEMGCGIGALGLVGTLLSPPSLLVLTDRAERGSNIVQQNVQHFSVLSTIPTVYHQLRWGDAEDTQQVLELCKKASGIEGSCYDTVIGSELMYFNTDVDIMVQAVMALTQKKGIFIHGHIFRGRNQESQLITFLAAHNWKTVEVPHKEFISAEELKQHAGWFNVRPLISGPADLVAKLMEEHLTWREFKEWYEEEVASEAML